MASKILNISEQVSIALHSLKMMVSRNRILTAAEIAAHTGMSVNHLSKVLRRMVVAEIASASKGPGGGFYVTQAQMSRPIMDVYVLFDGEPPKRDCMYSNSPCDKKKCVFGELICTANRAFLEHFNNTKIGDLAAGSEDSN